MRLTSSIDVTLYGTNLFFFKGNLIGTFSFTQNLVTIYEYGFANMEGSCAKIVDV